MNFFIVRLFLQIFRKILQNPQEISLIIIFIKIRRKNLIK